MYIYIMHIPLNLFLILRLEHTIGNKEIIKTSYVSFILFLFFYFIFLIIRNKNNYIY